MSKNYDSVILQGWLSDNSESWSQYTNHEFVRGLGEGTLPRSAFITYLIQDYIFLLHYSRAWAMAIVKSETAGQIRVAAATVNALINQEIQLHIQICEREGITEKDLLVAEEANENIAYTRYVMDTALSGDLMDLLSVMAPCVFGYGQIGLNLQASQPKVSLYRQWIDTYCGEAYQSVCATVAALIDEVSAVRLGNRPLQHSRWPGLSAKFNTATKLEVGFWSMGLRLDES